jgi:hypothetical protein
MRTFEIATGLSTGHTHRKLAYNCQDAYAIHHEKDLIVGVVADGCGAGRHSEVGAQLGTAFVMEFCKRHFRHERFDAAFLLQNLIEYLHQFCDMQMPSDRERFIEDHLLFTLFGFVVKPTDTHVFHAGDGFVGVNEEVWNIDQNNIPSYIGRHLLGQKATIVSESYKTDKIERLLIATDGLRDLAEPVLPWTNKDVWYSQPVNLPKFLDEASAAGILKDDCAVVMLRPA